MDQIPEKTEVEFIYLPVINFAMQQNGVSVIRRLSIKNRGENNLTNIKVVISAEPGFGDAAPVFIDTLPGNEIRNIDSLRFNLSTNYFAQLTERISGYITLEVFSDNETLFKQAYPIDILAYDQWGGISVLPEMLTAFITPNHPAIIPVIQRAAAILGQWTGNPSLDEYQSRNPDRVRKQMAAIYTAIAEQQIIYSTVPASFEEYGQRVRLADIVMSQKLGTCLDMALFYASCLEAVGIHALIVIIKGHAFAGGWLVPETFPDTVTDDVSLLSKRIADGINDITLVETTCMNMGKNTEFDQAEKFANAKLNPSDFIHTIDVKRARFSGIRPVPQRILNGDHWEIKEDEKNDTDQSQTKPQAINPYDLSGISPEVKITKQLLWERKLLDLSLRNNLLNVRITKNTLQIISVNLDLLEDALSNGEEFRILHKPTDWDNPLYDFGLYHKVSDSDPVKELIESELTQKRLRSYLTENELGKALTHLYRSSRTSMEENGANTLYLALGLLKWYETKSSERPRYAPVLLIPVEIIRKSAAKGYVIRTREEETMMNITLLEMLRQNFNLAISGLDPLPVDESGVNVRLIYSIIRNGIKNQPKWDVEEQAILGIFSFNKFIMWNDIHNNADKLAKNKIVSSLMNGRIEWDVNTEMADAAELDKKLSPAEILLPISADSSQLEAIYEASNNKSFILHGPPGTGKSQTITNLIANALYRGKRVLFVAEKMAALSVVESRLKAIGLSPFCLELHSNKSKKTAILAQLKETSEVTKVTPPENYRKEADRILTLRSELNIYIESLHKIYPSGLSLYEAITRYLTIDADEYFEIPLSCFQEAKAETIQQWQEAIENLVRIANACGHPYNHPLTGINIPVYSSALKDEAYNNICKTVTILSKIKPESEILPELFGERVRSINRQNVEIFSRIISKLLLIPELYPALLTQPRLNEALDEFLDICKHGRKRDCVKENVLSGFAKEVLSVDAAKLSTKWKMAADKWFLPRFFGQNKIKKQLKPYAKNKLNNEIIPSILENIAVYQEEKNYVYSNAENFKSLFGKYGQSENEDWAIIEQIIEDVSVINSLIFKFTKDIPGTSDIKELLSRQLSEGIASFKNIYAGRLSGFNNLLAGLSEQEKLLAETLGISINELYKGNNWVDSAIEKLNTWSENIEKLKDWYQWLSAYNKMDSLGLGFVADKYKDCNIDTSRLPDIFNKSIYKTAASFIFSKDPALELFNGKIFSDIIEKYKCLSLEFEQLTKKELFAHLASGLPSFAREAAQNSEVGILQRNIRNNARGLSIRKLFDQIPTLLSRMCPCMLMSPISVAQYIDADAEKFDLIVFDEASQMPTYEAVGAIARGKNVIIVGDPKQMPPTSFFSANVVDEENIEMEDLESILDDCLALTMPSKHLLWHYRSKHESLIAFSNSEYYENKLLTFPSVDNIESKVRLVQVDGCYDKGKTRRNKSEAQAVVNEIARRLNDPELRKKSIGVVTFSIVQQSLIEDLLSDLFVTNPELEAFALGCEEPIFIKNLENVQGDERDVILFSVCYGPDKNGQVSMNFGPLNRLGGERRLNVAVSRARYEMIIYSTLKPEQIDLNRSSSIGVAGLKRFLEYAVKGEHPVVNNQLQIEKKAAIHMVIAGKLQDMGYKVHTNIGYSGYKIDIGIVDEENPYRYKLGIICDGENYRKTKTVRDREIVQDSVLKMLGWNIFRIWTLDWWEKPDEVLTNIKQILDAAVNPVKPVFPEKTEITEELKSRVATKPVDLHTILLKKNENEKKYSPAKLPQVKYPSDDFYNPVYRNFILNQIDKVVQSEAPVSRSLLYKRILSAWGISRLGQKLNTYFDSLLSVCNYYKSEHQNLIFYWKNESQYATYKDYRTGTERDAADLPPEEVANAMKQILEDEISMPRTELTKICRQYFGFSRTGTNVEAAMERGLLEAVCRGYIKEDNGRVKIA